jgi:hypothetical protein
MERWPLFRHIRNTNVRGTDYGEVSTVKYVYGEQILAGLRLISRSAVYRQDRGQCDEEISMVALIVRHRENRDYIIEF